MVVCTGDITTTGEPAEFQAALRVLLPLTTQKGVRFIFVPGNHDIYVDNPKCRRAVTDAFRLLNEAHFALDGLPASFTLGGLDFCVVNECRPTSLFSSCGYVDSRTSEFVREWVAGPKPLPRVLIGHFPILKLNPVTDARHRLWGQEDIADAINKGLVDLSLCGHCHDAFEKVDDRGRGEVCPGSLTRHASATEIVYDPAADRFTHIRIDLRSHA